MAARRKEATRCFVIENRAREAFFLDDVADASFVGSVKACRWVEGPLCRTKRQRRLETNGTCFNGGKRSSRAPAPVLNDVLGGSGASKNGRDAIDRVERRTGHRGGKDVRMDVSQCLRGCTHCAGALWWQLGGAAVVGDGARSPLDAAARTDQRRHRAFFFDTRLVSPERDVPAPTRPRQKRLESASAALACVQVQPPFYFSLIDHKHNSYAYGRTDCSTSRHWETMARATWPGSYLRLEVPSLSPPESRRTRCPPVKRETMNIAGCDSSVAQRNAKPTWHISLIIVHVPRSSQNTH